MPPKRNYPSTELTVSQRELLARLVVPLQSYGISRTILRKILAEAHLPVSRSSLNRWVHTVVATGHVLSVEKAHGPGTLLDSEQCEIAAGWVLSQNDSNQVVSLASFAHFCSSVLGVDLGRTTVHDYLHRLGFSSRVSQTKASGYAIDVDALSKMMVEWKCNRQRAGDLKGLLASVDFTFTGHRTHRQVSFAPIGGAQPRSGRPISPFTNCIVTVVWSDGVNRTPPAIFTHNGKFRLDRVGRKAWVQDREVFVSTLARYGIEAKRVIYLGTDTTESRTYVSESADLLRRFFELYEIPKQVIVFSDQGAAFFPDGKSALRPLGFAKHRAYPAPVHQYLSPNDNRLHGTAKTRWRNSRVDFKNDVESSLMLLHDLDVDLAEYGETWFTRNILELTARSARELIRGRSGERAQVDADRLQAYRLFIGVNAEGGPAAS